MKEILGKKLSKDLEIKKNDQMLKRSMVFYSKTLTAAIKLCFVTSILR